MEPYLVKKPVKVRDVTPVDNEPSAGEKFIPVQIDPNVLGRFRLLHGDEGAVVLLRLRLEGNR